MNDRRQVVGFTKAPSSSVSKGFAFFQSTYLRVDFPSSSQTLAWGITLSGDIVGYYVDSTGHVHGFLRTRGTD